MMLGNERRLNNHRNKISITLNTLGKTLLEYIA